MNRSRILVVGPPLTIGGTERHLAKVLPALARRGFDVHLHVMARGGELEQLIAEAGIEIEGPPPGLSRPIRATRFLAGLVARLRSLRPDLVHLFLPEPVLIGSIAARISGRFPIIVSRRSLSTYRAGRATGGALERLATRHADALIGNSRAVSAELLSESGDARKIGLIYNGIVVPELITVEERAVRRARIGIAPDAFLLMTVANLLPYKGHADLIAALALAAPRLPDSWRLALVGRDGGIGEELDKMLVEAGLQESVLRVGVRPDATELVAAADLAVLPSHEEGFSNALIEGMAAGTPSIATRVGGNVDAIEHGVSGLLASPRDPRSIAEAIERLVENPDLARQLGCAARARIQSRFEETTMLDRYERLWSVPEAIGRTPTSDILAGY